ncbi:TRM11 family SAM-dependent methyltransferase [Halalkalibacter alkalisediminis]|uniref:TRM11 family SAM-dependent methyltransferase n=1 Tax=Halalkalibacter alkalisediminis TaxID=935616 RepID=A0ABV6NIZ8_9BACI|nr:RNA methyltransferase [Halalkalibacter alkalisediminis]
MTKKYIYMYSYHEDEDFLCKLEMRSLFGFDTSSSILHSTIKRDPSRSPFIKARVDVLFQEASIEQLIKNVKELNTIEQTCKVMFVQHGDQKKTNKVEFQQRRSIEREVGLNLPGEVDLVNPEIIFGILKVDEGWVFGDYIKSKAVWLKHQVKPHNYSTALSTRVARAVVNIAVPDPNGLKVIDPCCGIGTVLIEALSMEIDIVGRDLNPLVIPGARGNVAYFGYTGEVVLGDMRNVTNNYDVAIIDMPYNLCSIITSKEKLEMIQSARQFSRKVVIVTVEPMDLVIEAAGFEIVDRCVARKGTFSREVLVCH